MNALLEHGQDWVVAQVRAKSGGRRTHLIALCNLLDNVPHDQFPVEESRARRYRRVGRLLCLYLAELGLVTLDALPKPRPPERCGGCRFYFTRDDETGRCHRRPPVVVPISDGVDWKFPIVPADEWCGEFERRQTT